MKNVDILQEKAKTAAAFAALPFVDKFRKFEKVITACFGVLEYSLIKITKKKLRTSEAHNIVLPATITPKVHPVFYHVSQFISQNQQGLGLFSKQEAREVLHSNFKPHWQSFKRQLIKTTHPEYGKYLLNCVVDFNSMRAQFFAL